jgi:hypothetical protein
LLSDPEPPDEDDPEFKEQMFRLHQDMGCKPEDLVGATPETREEYAKWLESERT